MELCLNAVPLLLSVFLRLKIWRTKQGLQAATQHTVFTLLHLSTKVWIATCKSILFYLCGLFRMRYRRTHLDPTERKYKEKGQNSTKTNQIMISAFHNFRVTKPRRMMQMGGAWSTRGTDEKSTDHEGKRPTKTSLKEHRGWSSQCVNQVQDRDRDGLYKRNSKWQSASPEGLCSAVLVLQLHIDCDAGWREATMTDTPISDFDIMVIWRSSRIEFLLWLSWLLYWTTSSSLLPVCKQSDTFHNKQ